MGKVIQKAQHFNDSQLAKKFHLYFKNYDFCENVKFGAILWKFNILSITA